MLLSDKVLGVTSALARSSARIQPPSGIGVTGPVRAPRADPGSDPGSRIGSEIEESIDVSTGRDGDLERSLTDPGSRAPGTSTLVLALEGLLGLGEDDEDDEDVEDESDESTSRIGDGATTSLSASITESSGIDASGPAPTRGPASGAGAASGSESSPGPSSRVASTKPR